MSESRPYGPRLKMRRGVKYGPRCWNRNQLKEPELRNLVTGLFAEVEPNHGHPVAEANAAARRRGVRKGCRRSIRGAVRDVFAPVRVVTQSLQIGTAEWATPPVGRLSHQGHPCHYCGRPADAIDHVWPRSRGGDDHANNLVRTCTPCNSAKGTRSLLTATCQCGERRDPSDVDTADGTAYYACRCGCSWQRTWDLQAVRL